MIIDMGLLFLLREVAGLHDLIANTISFTAAATSNYFLNRIWTFRSKDENIGTEYAKFLLVSVIGLCINNGILALSSLFWPNAYSGLFPNPWDIPLKNFYLFKLLAIAITTLWNFFGNMLFTFKKKQ